MNKESLSSALISRRRVVGLTFFAAGSALAWAFGDALSAAQDSPRAAAQQNAPDPWSAGETVDAATLAKEVSDPNAANRPTVACVGFRILYDGGHVPGASYHGPASNPAGLADLRKWAEGVPRSTNLVIYCGCCPMDHCPNLRPAFNNLREMGFTHLRVLVLPKNFATDWAAAGYAYDKGK